jgi:hypothetical protein
MAGFSLKPIAVSKDFLDPAAYERAINNTLDGIAEDIRIDLEVTTQTWINKPVFQVEKDDEIRRIFTTSDIYRYISGGTRVRYATMTPDFIAKTIPGVIGSGAGRGGVAFISKLHPRPGIEARNFPEVIIKKWQPRIAALLQQNMDNETHR